MLSSSVSTSRSTLKPPLGRIMGGWLSKDSASHLKGGGREASTGLGCTPLLPLGHMRSPSWDRGHGELRSSSIPHLGMQKEPQALLSALCILCNIRITGPWLLLIVAVTTGAPGRGREFPVWFVHKNLGESLRVTRAW